MPDLKNITVNGVPLEKVIAEETSQEIQSNHQTVVKSLSFVKRIHTRSKSYRNFSGARSGRGRVIYSVAMGGAL